MIVGALVVNFATRKLCSVLIIDNGPETWPWSATHTRRMYKEHTPSAKGAGGALARVRGLSGVIKLCQFHLHRPVALLRFMSTKSYSVSGALL